MKLNLKELFWGCSRKHVERNWYSEAQTKKNFFFTLPYCCHSVNLYKYSDPILVKNGQDIGYKVLFWESFLTKLNNRIRKEDECTFV